MQSPGEDCRIKSALGVTKYLSFFTFDDRICSIIILIIKHMSCALDDSQLAGNNSISYFGVLILMIEFTFDDRICSHI